MQTNTDRQWTSQGFLGWAFGEQRLAELSGAIHHAALRAQYLCDVPLDDCVRAELARNLTGIARQAERIQLDPPAALARRLARALTSPRAGADVLARVRDGCATLEQRVAELVAHDVAGAQCQSAA